MWESDDSGGRKTDFSLDSVEEMKVLGGGQLGKAGKNVPQPLETNFSLVAGCETKVVGAGSGSTAQCRPSGGEQRFPRVGVAVADPDSARGHAHLRGDFQKTQSNRSRLGLGPLGSDQSDAPQRVQQDVSQGGKIKTKLVGPHRLGAQPVAEQTQLLLDAILHLAPRTVELFVEGLRQPLRFAKRRDHVEQI